MTKRGRGVERTYLTRPYEHHLGGGNKVLREHARSSNDEGRQ